jgi:hypothetical protein
MKNRIKKILMIAAALFGCEINLHGAVGKLLAEDVRLAVDSVWTTAIATDEILTNFDVVGKFDVGERQLAKQREPGWWVELLDADGVRLARIEVISQSTVANFNDSRDIIVSAVGDESAPRLSCLVSSEKSGSGSPIAVTLECDYERNITIWTGCNEIKPLGKLQLSGRVGSIRVSGSIPIEIVSTNMKTQPDNFKLLNTGLSEDELLNYFAASANPHEGIYLYVDGSYEMNKYRKGGEYRLAIKSDGNGGYDILYLGGATENTANWKPGMKKGRLIPTNFIENFNLLWYDAQMNFIAEEQWAAFTLPLLELHFPLQGSTMRFSRQ